MDRGKSLDDVMIAKCVGDQMAKMSTHEECMWHLAVVAPKEATVDDLSRYCSGIGQVFSVSDATQLCTGLNGVHKNFWQRFMQ